MVAAHHLPELADHGPAALDVQSHPLPVKTEGLQIGLRVLHDPGEQAGEAWMAMELPHALEVSRPGAAWIGIGAGSFLQGRDGLDLQCGLERIRSELRLPQRQRKQRLDKQLGRGGSQGRKAGTKSMLPHGAGGLPKKNRPEGRWVHMAEAPPTTSRISWVMAACRALL